MGQITLPTATDFSPYILLLRLYSLLLKISSIRMDGGFDDVVGAVGKEGVGFLNAAKRVAVGYQMGRVNLAF